ncbi:hypothetical protein B484DRAFT_403071 [Ochromonadaceae sp. CCMP2298]|nr:hypothetical protein B484DRAFT_403071 [Ochromonadaceae sp. CCMP2298]
MILQAREEAESILAGAEEEKEEWREWELMRWEAETKREKGAKKEIGGERCEVEQYSYEQGGKAGIPGTPVAAKKWKKTMGGQFEEKGVEEWGAAMELEREERGERRGDKGGDKGWEETCAMNHEPVQLNVGSVRYITNLRTQGKL